MLAMLRDLDTKIWAPAEVPDHCEQLHRDGQTIVFTNGCFDILHAGHVRYLAEARKLGDLLLIGVNADESVRRLKGEGRPMVPLADRLVLLAAMESVDAVTWFEEDTPENLIRAVRPNIHAKGGDYTADQIGEAPLVLELGGRVEVLPFIEGRSTSELIRRILSREPGKLGG